MVQAARLSRFPRIPEGDSYSSRGQRPRTTDADVALTLKGSNAGCKEQGAARLPGRISRMPPAGVALCDPFRVGSIWRAFRGRCPRLLCSAPAGQDLGQREGQWLAPLSGAVSPPRLLYCAPAGQDFGGSPRHWACCDTCKSPKGIHTDRGREDRVVPFPPPSEPDGRISRIRLSSRWFYLRED